MGLHIDLWTESSRTCIAVLWRHYPMSKIAIVLRGMPAVTLHCRHLLATKEEFDKWQHAACKATCIAAPYMASFFKVSFEPMPRNFDQHCAQVRFWSSRCNASIEVTIMLQPDLEGIVWARMVHPNLLHAYFPTQWEQEQKWEGEREWMWEWESAYC